MSEEETVEEAVKRIQDFEASQIARVEDLGRELAFTDAIEPISRISELFRQIPVANISELSASAKDIVNRSAKDVSNIISQIRDFETKSENPHHRRQQLLETIRNKPDQLFDNLQNVISYLASRQRDFSGLADEARKARDDALREADEIRTRLKEAEKEANRILDEVRKTAAEEGVTQQAKYFHGEAETHSTKADKWQGYTIKTAIGLGGFAVLSLVGVYLLPTPVNTYEAFQVGLSKILIFATIAYMLFLCARTLTAHRHNVVVNRHRQNALRTFNALVEASSADSTRDVVLNHAAACIFAPQETGFAKSGTPSPGSPLVEIMPKIFPPSPG